MPNSKKIILKKILLLFIACSFMKLSVAQNQVRSGQDAMFLAVKTNEPEAKNIFRGTFPTANIQEFEAFAKQMARLKPFGNVDVRINSCAMKADFEIPKGGSPWHEYSAYNQTVHIFFPDVELAPFLPVDFVKKNQELLFAKVAVIRRFGLGATWAATDPLFLPEPFFEKYPGMRGPRVDHPRRSNHQEFAACFHQPETIEMYQKMVNTLFKNVPEINSFSFHMNDAGSGQCWAAEQYTGPNGPTTCKGLNISESVVSFIKIYEKAAKEIAGHDIDISFGGMFQPQELSDIANKIKEEDIVLVKNKYPSKNASSMLVAAWPVRGIIDPLQIMRSLNRGGNKGPFRYSLNFGEMYDRGQERLETIEKVVDMVEDNLKNPPLGEAPDTVLAMNALRRMCVKWAGEKSADTLVRAFVALNKTFQMNRKISAFSYNALYYLAVSTRHITRPLVFAPQRLTPEEEKYFLPYVFNVSIDEARNAYTDMLGRDITWPDEALDNFVISLKNVYTSIGTIKNAPEQKFLDDMVRSLHLFNCVMRSCNNFHKAQVIRDRNKVVLAGTVHLPPKEQTDTGDADLQLFNRTMRDEFDNTQEMIDLLENGGMDFIVHAKPPFREDTFLLGADLIEQLKLKRKIMMTHWRDIEGYLTTPYI